MKAGVLNNKDLRCLPRAEINNSLTGEVGKQAVRVWAPCSAQGDLVVAEELSCCGQPWEQAVRWAPGEPGGTVGTAQGRRGRARAAERMALWPGGLGFSSCSATLQLSDLGQLSPCTVVPPSVKWGGGEMPNSRACFLLSSICSFNDSSPRTFYGQGYTLGASWAPTCPLVERQEREEE